jgi:hypothetical protein
MTDAEKLRILIGDNPADESQQEFSDEELGVFLDVENGELLLAAAMALDALAAKADITPHQVSIGKFQYSAGRTQIRQLTAQAEAFRKRAYETPAFAMIEENLSDANQYVILRDQILRSLGNVDVVP